jgi:O-antigen/teichoic acid export membrane protein
MGCLALISGPLTARMLGPAGRGQLAAIQNLFWVVATLAMLGFPEATLYFTARNPKRAGRVLSSALVLTLVAAPLCYLAIYRFIPRLLTGESTGVITAARWYLAFIPLYALTVIPTFAMRGTNDLVRWNLCRLLPGIGWLLFLIGVWSAVKPTPELLARGYLVVLAVVLVPLTVALRKCISGPFTLDKSIFRSMLGYSIPLAGATVPQTLNPRIDQLFIAAFLPAHVLGLYVVAVSWSGATAPLLNAIGNVLFPRIAVGSPEDRATTLTQGVRLGMLTGSVLVLILGVLTPVAITRLFGTAFSPAIPAALVLVLAAFISGLNGILEESLRGLGDTRAVFHGEATGLLVTVAGLALMLRPFGIVGAGFACLIGYSATAAVLVPRVLRNASVTLAQLLVPGYEDLRLLSAWAQGLGSAFATMWRA